MVSSCVQSILVALQVYEIPRPRTFCGISLPVDSSDRFEQHAVHALPPQIPLVRSRLDVLVHPRKRSAENHSVQPHSDPNRIIDERMHSLRITVNPSSDMFSHSPTCRSRRLLHVIPREDLGDQETIGKVALHVPHTGAKRIQTQSKPNKSHMHNTCQQQTNLEQQLITVWSVTASFKEEYIQTRNPAILPVGQVQALQPFPWMHSRMRRTKTVGLQSGLEAKNS